MNRPSYVALERLQNDIRYLPAVESFNLLTNIMDAAVRIFHNIKVSILGAFKNFKRSELKAYHDSRTGMIKKLYDTRPISLLSTKVPIPHELVMTYPQALTTIKNALDKLDLKATLDTIYEYTNSLEQAFQNPERIDYRHMSDELNRIIPKVNHISKDELHKLIESIFSHKQSNKELPFKEAFGSYQDLEETDNTLLGYETLFQEVPNICDKISKIEAVIGKTVTELTVQGNPDRDFLKSLHAFVYVSAVQFDSLGVLLSIIQQLEHNFTIALNILVNANSRL